MGRVAVLNDHVAVLNGVKDLVPLAAVRAFVMDFELAYWLVANGVFPRASRRGRLSHWRQCLFREIQKLGFPKSYEGDPDKRHFMRAVMAPPLLPAADAPRGLDKTTSQIRTLVAFRD